MSDEWGPLEIAAMFSYDAETGLFVWRDRPDGHFSRAKDGIIWRKRFLGKPAFITDNGKGYKCANIGGRRIYAHRAAFACMTGRFPTHEVDHINGNPSDNRWSNLRDVPARVNCRNKASPAKRAASGIQGIYRANRPSCWVPQISVGNQSISLGATACLGIALKRRRAAEAGLGFHPNHGRQANVR